MNSPECIIICKGFQVFFCYILGEKVTDLVSLRLSQCFIEGFPNIQGVRAVLIECRKLLHMR